VKICHDGVNDIWTSAALCSQEVFITTWRGSPSSFIQKHVRYPTGPVVTSYDINYVRVDTANIVVLVWGTGSNVLSMDYINPQSQSMSLDRQQTVCCIVMFD